jgi:hypothetical protein
MIILKKLFENFNNDKTISSRVSKYRTLELCIRGDIIEENQESQPLFFFELLYASVHHGEALGKALSSCNNLEEMEPEPYTNFDVKRIYVLVDFKNRLFFLASSNKENIKPSVLIQALQGKHLGVKVDLDVFVDKEMFEKFSKGKYQIKDVGFTICSTTDLYYRYSEDNIKSQKISVKLENISIQDEVINFAKNLINKNEDKNDYAEKLKIWDTRDQIFDLIGGRVEYEFRIELNEDKSDEDILKLLKQNLIYKYNTFKEEYLDVS